MLKFKYLFVAFSFLALSSPGLARPGQKGERGHRRPPQEAINACQSKEATNECSFEGKRGLVSGQCFSPSSEKPLACRPSHKEQKSEM